MPRGLTPRLLTGMSGPPLIMYLGAKFKKELFRSIIVPIFLIAAIGRFSTYIVLGMVNLDIFVLYLFPAFGVILGNYIGNKFFKQINQQLFTILIGIILLFSGLQLII